MISTVESVEAASNYLKKKHIPGMAMITFFIGVAFGSVVGTIVTIIWSICD